MKSIKYERTNVSYIRGNDMSLFCSFADDEYTSMGTMPNPEHADASIDEYREYLKQRIKDAQELVRYMMLSMIARK